MQRRCFNPRAPCGARRRSFSCPLRYAGFNPRAPCGARLCLSSDCGDAGVSIHAPRAGRDAYALEVSVGSLRFQSTRPVRGATGTQTTSLCHFRGFNPRAPCGARRVYQLQCHQLSGFQSTRPVRGATERTADGGTDRAFQSTRPVRGATGGQHAGCNDFFVSIHAPRAGRDVLIRTEQPRSVVSIHAPRAGRDYGRASDLLCKEFQSTRPVRGATAKEVTISLFCHIFMGVTRHEYDFLGAHAPRPSFSVIHAPTFLHLIFCSLHLRTLPCAHMMIAASMS